MGNYLETIPSDILQYIALLATTGSHPVLTTPRTVLSLLLTSSTLYRSLHLKSCPHLYADIFRTTFDIRATRRRFSFQLTDSALAREFVFRRKMLRNIRRRSFLTTELRQDLWTAFWMVQESDGLNELHLRCANLPDYLLDIIKHWANHGIFRKGGPIHELQSLVIWLLCFTLSQEYILSLSPDTRDALLYILLPYSWNGHRPSAINTSFLLSGLPWCDRVHGFNYAQPSAGHSITHHQCQCPLAANPIVIYAREWVSQCPDPAPAAINLLFCLKEIDPMVVPDHLPENRTIAIATQRFGPTKEDVWKIRGYRTKLFSDTTSWSHTLNHPMDNVRRSENHDFEFQRIVFADNGATEVRALPAMLGMMAGIWEGFYMCGSLGVADGRSGRASVRHHRAVFAEFVCLDDNDTNLPTLDDISGERNLLKLCSRIEPQGGFELDGHKYERLTAGSGSHRGCGSGEEAREPVDILLLGETLEDHAQAWGGFGYAGRIRKDGSIILKREPKEAGGDGFSGVWIFEGRVRFGTVFVGRCYSGSHSVNNTFSVQGIFSMQKRVNGLTSW